MTRQKSSNDLESLLDPALAVQRAVLSDFHRRAAAVTGQTCRVRRPGAASLDRQRNLFSTLFLIVMRAAGLPEPRLPFYGLINQCMRAWVTACDNLLDDERKVTIPFDLPEGGYRFRSVMEVMTADRVLADLLAGEVAAARLTEAQALALSHETLRILMPSGLQEHEEESGARMLLPPERLLEIVHVPKTGLLFEAPVALPERLGEVDPDRAAVARAGLRAFGLACQILDDVVDLQDDLRDRHHNYVLSLAAEMAGCAGAARADVDPVGLPLERALPAAARRAAELFSQARTAWAGLGLRCPDEQWAMLLGAIAMQLRVPESIRSEFLRPKRRRD